jgi:nucleoside-diphosphate-sugar epimerase
VKIAMRKVLITGATGFIGSHCIAPLLASGYEVHALSSQISPRHHAAVTWHQVNLLDIERVANLMATVQPTHLLHLAWYILPGTDYFSAIENFEWVQASLALLQQFHDRGGERVVFVGSDAEYDSNYGYCSTVYTPRNPSTFYGKCKNSLYSLFEAYTHQTGLSGAWARFFCPYGPHEHPQRLIPTAICALLERRSARFSHGQQIRDFLYVQDCADALVTLLNSSMTGALNIASGQPTSLRTVISTIARKLNGEDLVLLGALPPRPIDPPLVVADVRRLTDELGWKPEYSLETGLAQTIEWWQVRQKVSH